MAALASTTGDRCDFDHPADRDRTTSLLESAIDGVKHGNMPSYTAKETQRLVVLIQDRAVVLLQNSENTKACAKAGDDVSNQMIDELAFTDRIRPTLVKAVIAETVAAVLNGGMILSAADREQRAMLVGSALELHQSNHTFNNAKIEKFKRSERKNGRRLEFLEKLELLLGYENTVVRMISRKMEMLARLQHGRRSRLKE